MKYLKFDIKGLLFNFRQCCSGQLIPDKKLSFSNRMILERYNLTTFNNGDKQMKILIAVSILLSVLISGSVQAGPHYVSGKVTSLSAHGTNPAIRLEGNVSPDDCDGGTYGWLYFKGTADEKMRIYSTALAMSLAGKRITVYTNKDGTTCVIYNIQITSGLN